MGTANADQFPTLFFNKAEQLREPDFTGHGRTSRVSAILGKAVRGIRQIYDGLTPIRGGGLSIAHAIHRSKWFAPIKSGQHSRVRIVNYGAISSSER